MPPFFHPSQITAALRNQAMPALEHLAANDDARNHALDRFERDEPPPYVSSTESEEFEVRPRTPPPNTLPEELQATLDRPLDEPEQRLIADDLAWKLTPSSRYDTEACLERHLLDGNHLVFGEQHKYAKERCNIIVRHIIKRRWSKLGIWNPMWGIPGRLNERPQDKIKNWHWRWDREMTRDEELEHGKHLVGHALSLRHNLRRGEACPAQPRSNLQPDATAPQAESFLISRPWFIWSLEVDEETARKDRLDFEHQRIIGKNVGRWWRERGDIKKRETAWFGPSQLFSWKWRHKSPSPEPEDLTPLRNVQETPLEAADIHFTPSEIDALEEIPPPEERGARNLTLQEIADRLPYMDPNNPFTPRYPLDNKIWELVDPWKVPEPLRPQGLSKPPEIPTYLPSKDLPPPAGSPEKQHKTVAEQPDNPRPLPPKQGSWRQGQGRRKANPSPDQTLRRSARIAALMISTKLSYIGADRVTGSARMVTSPITMPSKQGTQGRPKARAIPAQPPPKKEDARAKQGRGRWRKINGVSKPSPMPTRGLAPGRAKRDNFPTAGAYATPSIAQASSKQSRQRRKRPETRTVLGNVQDSKSGRRRKPAAPQVELATVDDLRTISQGNSSMAAVATRALWRNKEQRAPRPPQLRLSGPRRPARAGGNPPLVMQAYRTYSGRVSKPPARWIPR